VDEVEVGTVRQHPDTLAVAIKTANPVPAMSWFVFHPVNGGHYTTGAREKLDEWPELEWPDAS
jgi:hypothetical protein